MAIQEVGGNHKMKLATLAILMVCITLTIVIFDQTQYIDEESGKIDFYNVSEDITTKDQVSTRVWSFFLEPSNWGTGSNLANYLIITVAGLLIIGTGVALVAKSYAPDTYVFAIFYTGVIGYGGIPVILLYGFIERNLGALMCTGGNAFCFFPKIIAIMIAGSLGFVWVMKCVNSWRTGQE